MMSTMSNRYEREEFIAAPLARVWAAISEPAQLKEWFAEPTYPLTPGGEGTLHFRFDDGSEATPPVQVVATEPPHRFAFRWRSHSADPAKSVADQANTLVEITLAEEADGTRVRIVESGFEALPDDVGATALRENTQGWDEVLRNLVTYVTRA
jgi:uncharacterized protein YndB with AHSA1/START domain